MRQAADKSQHDTAPRLVVEQLETALQRSRLCRAIDLLDHIRLERRVAQRRIIRQDLAAELADRVERAKAHDPGEPSRAGTTLGRKRGGVLPNLHESLLQHIGGDFRPPDDAQRDAVEPARFELIEPL